VLLAREEKVLQGMIDRLIEIGRRYGMEMKVGKTKVMKISRQLLDDLKEKKRYWKLKEEALDRTLWRTRFGRG
jgi:hypothetical protein